MSSLRWFSIFTKDERLHKCDICNALFTESGSIKDGLPYLFHSFRNKYFNKISLGNMLYFQNKL